MSLFPAYAANSGSDENNHAVTPTWNATFTSFPSSAAAVNLSDLSHQKVEDDHSPILESGEELGILSSEQQREGNGGLTNNLERRSENHDTSRKRMSRHSEERQRKKYKKERKRKKEKKYESRKPEPGKQDREKHISDGQVYAKFNHKLVFSDKTGLPPEEAFRLDTKGDKNNFSFSRPSANITAKFRSISCHQVLGDHPNHPSAKNRRPPDRYFFHKHTSAPEKVSSRGDMGELPSLIGDPAVVEKSLENPLGLYDSATVSYISGTSKVREEAKNTVESEESVVRKKVKEFNRKLSRTPKDLTLWMQYVDFQNQAVTFDFESGSKKQRVSASYLAEKKLSILERAAGELPSCAELLIKRLQIGDVIWTNDELRLQWLEALKRLPSSLQLWGAYLDFMEHSTEFKVGDVLGGYRRCFLKLKNVLATLAGKRKEDLEMGLRGIFHRLNCFLISTGYTEKAVALYQAQLELAVRTQLTIIKDNRFPVLLELFDRFWDSHVPRLGEEGSQPWSVVLDLAHVVGRRHVNVSSDEANILKSSKSMGEKWLEIETQRERLQWLPWTPTEEEDEVDDKDRHVTLEDLKPYLFQVTSGNCAVSLVTDFIRLLGCPSHNEATPSTPIGLELALNQEIPQMLLPSDWGIQLEMLRGGVSSTLVSFVHNVISQCFPCLGEMEQVSLLKFWLDYEGLKVRCLKDSSEHFASYWKYLKKKLKNFFSDEKIRTNVSLFTKYILLCDAAGESENAQRFFATVFASQNRTIFDLPTVDKNALLEALLADTRTLLNKYERREVSKEQVIGPLVQLLCEEKFVAERIPGAASVLRARKRAVAVLSDFEADASPEEMKYQVMWCCCCLHLLFFSEGLKAAIKAGKEFLENFEQLDVRYKEEVQATMLALGSIAVKTQQIGSFALHSELLLSSLRNLPSSSVVLKFFLDYQKTCKGSKRLLDGALKILQETSEKRNLAFAVSLTYAMRHEHFLEGEDELWKEIGMNNPLVPDGLKHKLRNFFDAVMSERDCRQDPLLWRMYFALLHSSGFGPQLKSVSYLALKECPLSKDILMSISRLLPDHFTSVCKLISDKDVRIRIPLEELELLLEEDEVGKEGEEGELSI